jgi:predicted phage-related endonuclease
MDLGNRFEAPVLDWMADQMAFLSMERNVSLVGAEPWMIANLDARGVLPENVKVVVEAKTAGLLGYSTNLEEWGEEGTDQIPQGYIAQCHWQMMIAGDEYRRTYVPLLINNGGLSFRLYVVNRDDGMCADIEAGAREFWDMVQDDVEPEGTISPSVAKRVKRNANVAPVQVPVDLFGNYQSAAEALKEAEEAKENAYGMLVGALGMAEWGVCPLGKVTFKEQTRKGLDQKALTADHPDLAAKYEKITTFRTLRVTAAK